MSEDVPGPTPEGQLIRRVRDLSIPKLTIRAAAERIGLSTEQWGYIERGYRPARAGEPPRPFSPPAATLAKMAHALRITPERLESEGQRPDAAEILREILDREVEAAPAAARSLPAAPPSNLLREDAARPYATPIWNRITALAAKGVRDPDGRHPRDWDPDDWDSWNPSAAQLGLQGLDAETWNGSRGAMSLSDRGWLVGDWHARREARSPLTSTG